jgi:hypothetical protein
MRGAMSFGSRKRRKSAGGVSHPSDPAPSQTDEPEFVQWSAWRCAAQKTTRAWNEWLAAGRRERPDLYRCYVSALAEEEQAAVEVERAVRAKRVDTHDNPTERSGICAAGLHTQAPQSS